MKQRQGSELVISYMRLRQAIGVLGVCLPLAVILGGSASSGWTVRSSISAYYYSNMRDVFVGLLCIVGAFLLSYKGYDRRDRILSAAAGALALGVAAFPTIRIETGSADEVKKAGEEVVGIFALPAGHSMFVHYGCAVLLFVCLGVISLQFTRTDRSRAMTRQKLRRNAVYRICGAVMFGAMALVPIFRIPGLAEHQPDTLVLFVEAVCLGAFGIAWLVKGEALLGDSKAPSTQMAASG
jgi:hypothetical protein